MSSHRDNRKAELFAKLCHLPEFMEYFGIICAEKYEPSASPAINKIKHKASGNEPVQTLVTQPKELADLAISIIRDEILRGHELKVPSITSGDFNKVLRAKIPAWREKNIFVAQLVTAEWLLALGVTRAHGTKTFKLDPNWKPEALAA